MQKRNKEEIQKLIIMGQKEYQRRKSMKKNENTIEVKKGNKNLRKYIFISVIFVTLVSFIVLSF